MRAAVAISTTTGSEILRVDMDDFDPFAMLSIKNTSVQLARDECRKVADALHTAALRKPFELDGRWAAVTVSLSRVVLSVAGTTHRRSNAACVPASHRHNPHPTDPRPARIALFAHRQILRLPRDWPWETGLDELFRRLAFSGPVGELISPEIHCLSQLRLALRQRRAHLSARRPGARDRVDPRTRHRTCRLIRRTQIRQGVAAT
jgi:hypothetical protein